MNSLAKFEAVAAIGSFALIFVSGLLRLFAVRAGMDEKTAETAMKCAVLGLFLIFGFACIGLMFQAFVALQIRIGNGGIPLIRFLAAHRTGITLAVWAFLGLGTLIALPFALKDLAGIEMPLGKSRGLLVADIGMTIDDVKRRSSLRIKEPRVMGDGSRMGVEDVVFDFQIGDSAVRFPQSRYYWLETPKGDPHIHVLNVGITPRKMSKPDLDTFRNHIQEQLFNAGWMPGHFLADSEETIRLWSGRRTAGDGRYWIKGNTLIIFETSRVDEEKRGEPPGSGEYIIALYFRPAGHERNLVFEPSAWPH